MRQPRHVTRERILQAAEEQFSRRGFQPASLEEIARAAHMTKGAVYSNFRGEDALFLAVLEAHVGRSIARYRTEAASANGDNPIEGLAAFLARSAVEDAAWSAAFAEFALHASRRPAIAEALAAMRGKLRREVIEVLRPIVDDGEADEARLERAATIFFALGNGLTLESLSDRSRVDKSLYREALERLLHS